jgi:hypothetical protein
VQRTPAGRAEVPAGAEPPGAPLPTGYAETGRDPYAGIAEGDRVAVLSFGKWKPATVVEVIAWPKAWSRCTPIPQGIRVALDKAAPWTEGSREIPRGLTPHDAHLVRRVGPSSLIEPDAPDR